MLFKIHISFFLLSVFWFLPPSMINTEFYCALFFSALCKHSTLHTTYTQTHAAVVTNGTRRRRTCASTFKSARRTFEKRRKKKNTHCVRCFLLSISLRLCCLKQTLVSSAGLFRENSKLPVDRCTSPPTRHPHTLGSWRAGSAGEKNAALFRRSSW